MKLEESTSLSVQGISVGWFIPASVVAFHIHSVSCMALKRLNHWSSPSGSAAALAFSRSWAAEAYFLWNCSR